MKYFITIVLLLCRLFALAQTAVYPNNGTLYDGAMHKVELLMSADSVTALFDPANSWTNHSYPATFVYDNADTVRNIGVRIKGNTSRNAQKQGIKLEIDEFVNQTYQGLKVFNLNGNHNDPSLTRELLSNYVMRKTGNICMRTNWVQLYINGVYYGLRHQVENIDKKFLMSRFGSSAGNLYKCSWPADLGWIDANANSYKNIINPSLLNERAYDLKTNTTADDYADLVHLISIVNNTPAAHFKDSIETIFDVQAYLKVLAGEVLIGHWDDYFYNKNNYFLYHNPATQKFVYLPYDMDNTFGIQWGVPNINVRDIHHWGNTNNTAAKLTSRILLIAQYNADYEQYMRDMIATVYNENYLFPTLDSLQNLAAPAIATDPFYTGAVPSDYGYTVQNWANSYTQAIDSHVSFGIKPFISDRKNSAINQFIFPPLSAPQLAQQAVELYPNPTNGFVDIRLRENALVEVWSAVGQKMQTQSLSWGNSRIDLSRLQAGCYWLFFRFENGDIATQKVVRLP